MARSISDEELQLRKRARRRLIGAIVLVLAVVVVLPMVLDSEPKPVNQDINIRIPSPDSGTFKSTIPAGSAAPQPGAASVPPAAEMKSPPQGAAAKPEVMAPPKESAKPEEKAAAAKSATEPRASREVAPSAAKAAEQFVVQVAALSDARKAHAMQKQVSAAGVKSYTEVVKTVKGDVTRVRAGPFATREAAEKARERLKTAGLDGKVIPAK